ncbi:Spectrin beta chain [Toxocara canis]|uniref:Spectrin beta chain n=1 Tax=Toxocara canis TaxID=6265 RepID=A0A0B2W665_TOXCA|nr:Spectrin beta chain [Toxocara canis]
MLQPPWVELDDERENVQKKTFTKWVNSHLVRVNCKIHDLYMDMRDGKMLIRLLEVLSGERLVRFSFSFISFHEASIPF